MRTDSMIGVRKSRTFQEEYWAFLKRHGAHDARNTSGMSCARSYRTLRDGSSEGAYQALRARLRIGVVPYGTVCVVERHPNTSSSSFVLNSSVGNVVYLDARGLNEEGNEREFRLYQPPLKNGRGPRRRREGFRMTLLLRFLGSPGRKTVGRPASW